MYWSTFFKRYRLRVKQGVETKGDFTSSFRSEYKNSFLLLFAYTVYVEDRKKISN